MPRREEEDRRAGPEEDARRGLDSVEDDAGGYRIGERNSTCMENDRDGGARRAHVGRGERKQRGQFDAGTIASAAAGGSGRPSASSATATAAAFVAGPRIASAMSTASFR